MLYGLPPKIFEIEIEIEISFQVNAALLPYSNVLDYLVC